MRNVIVPFVLATLLYVLLHVMEERKAREKHEGRASSGAKVGLFFFLFVLCMVGYYWWSTSRSPAQPGLEGAVASPADGGMGGQVAGVVASMTPAKEVRSLLPQLESELIQRIKHEAIHYGGPPF